MEAENASFFRGRAPTLLIVIVMCLGTLLPLVIPAAAYTWEEPVDVPYWLSGDTWDYWTISTEVVHQTQSSPGLYTINIDQRYISDNTTYTAGSTIVKTEGYDTYRQSVSGEAEFWGTYEYIDLLGLGLDESGCFKGTANNNGQAYRRVSDLAFVKSTLTVQESVTFYVGDCDGSVSSLLGSQNGNGNSEAVASPPINDLKFPLEAGMSWDTDSTVTTTLTPQGGTQTTSTTVYDFANHVNGTVSHTVPAGTFEAFEIHESGTKTRDGDITDLDQSVYYSPDVKNTIDKSQESERLTDYSVQFHADLNITQWNISVVPASPAQGADAVVNATIWNHGHEDATNFKAELWVGVQNVDNIDVASVVAGGSTNVSFDWVPATAGTVSLKVKVDSGLAVQEYREDNNEATISVDVTEPRPDLKVEASDIDVPVEVPVETLATIKADIHNVGNKEASDFVVRFYEGADLIGGDQTYDLLNGGDSLEASVVWQPATLGSRTIRVVVDPNGAVTELSESNNEASVAVNVVQLNYSFTMSITDNSEDVEPNGTAQFQVNIKNTGKKQDTVNLILSPAPTDWTTSVDKPSLTLTPGSSQPVIVDVRAPLKAPADTKVDLTLQGISTGDTAFKQNVDVHVTVLQVAGAAAQLKTLAEDMDGLPGETVIYQVTIENTGNAVDTFSLSVDTQKGWTTTLGSSTTDVLAVGGKKTVEVQTTIPETALANDKEAVTLTAVSDFDGSYKKETTLVVTCLQVYDLGVSVTPPTVDAEPGDTAVFTAQIANDGNGQEDVNLTISSTPELPEDFVVDMDATVTVRTDKEKDVMITIQIPDDALAEDYTLTLEVVGGEGEVETSIFTLEVLQVHSVEVEILPPSAQVKAGKTFVYSITVTNTGNGEDTFELTALNIDPKHTVTFSESEVTLDPEDSVDITLTIKAKSGSKGNINFDVRASSKVGTASDSVTAGLSIKAVAQEADLTAYILIAVVVAGVAGIAAVVWFKRTRG